MSGVRNSRLEVKEITNFQENLGNLISKKKQKILKSPTNYNNFHNNRCPYINPFENCCCENKL